MLLVLYVKRERVDLSSTSWLMLELCIQIQVSVGSHQITSIKVNNKKDTKIPRGANETEPKL